MGNVLIHKKEIRQNKQLRSIQKAYLKQYRQVKGKYPKGKLGKVVALVSDECIRCTEGVPSVQDAMGQPIVNLDLLQPQALWQIFKEADIRGLSGSNFPTIKKLETVYQAKVNSKFFIINGLACDPGLLHDQWLMKTHMKEIKMGIEVISKLIGCQKVILATPDQVPNRYPMGEESILIKTLLGIELDKNQIPAEKGILVLNVQTVYALYKAIVKSEVQEARYITVADLTTGAAHVAKVYMGQPVKEVIEKVKKFNEQSTFLGDTKQCYIGSGIMSAEPIRDEQKISAETGVLAFGTAYQFNNEAKCKGCGACTHKCPKGIKVHKVIGAIERGQWSLLHQYAIDECLQCGSCSYYCKAGKNIMEIIEKAKESLYEKK